VQLSHAAALLDMEQKYADVLPSGAVLAWLQDGASRHQRANAER
jgi:hypothetical protein